MPPATSSLAARLRAGTPTFVAWVGINDPALPELFARDGFDAVILDWQHGHHDTRTVAAGISAAAAGGCGAFVRLGLDDYAEGARMLDWGASGIIAPMISSAEEARRLVATTKYPPIGQRSWGPVRAQAASGLSATAFLHAAATDTIVLAMIETRAALAALDDILAVPGLDGVFLGPADLSIALSNGAHVDAFHADVDAAITTIAERAKAHGKICGAFCGSGARAGELARRGYALMCVSNDFTLLREAGIAELARARAAIAG